MKGRIFFIVFFGIFAAFAVGFFWFKTLPMLTTWYQAQSWQPVLAIITDADLKVSHGDDSTTYKVTANYHYNYQRKNYTGNKVSLSKGFDNIGSYHQDMRSYLQSLKNKRQPVTVWVNPEKPEESIIDRKMRWGLLLFESVFFVLFGLIGFGGIAFGLSKHANDDLPNMDAGKPWLSKKYWAQQTILSNAKLAHRVVLFFAIFWNLASIGAYFAVYEALQGKAQPAAYIAIVFPMIGFVMIWWAIKLRYQWNKIGATPLALDPYPGSVGGQVGGYIDINYPGVQRNSLLIKLSCLKNYRSGDDNKQSVIWEEQVVPAVDATFDGSRISFCFDVPDDLPLSEEHDSNYHEWQVSLEGELPDNLKLDRQYEIPVFRTGKMSSIRSMQAKPDNAATQKMYEQQVSKVMPLIKAPDGSLQIHFPAGRSALGSLAAVLVGALFAGIGMFLQDAPTMMRWIFSFLGWLVILSGIYTVANSLKVRIATEGLYMNRYLFGLPIKKAFVASYAFNGFDYKKTSTEQSGNKHTEYFKVVAKSQGNKDITIAEGLKGRGQAQAVIDKLIKQMPFR